MVPNTTTFQDWLKAHAALMEAEQQFSRLAADFDAARATKKDLDAAYMHVQALRALCDAVFQKAVANLGNTP